MQFIPLRYIEQIAIAKSNNESIVAISYDNEPDKPIEESLKTIHEIETLLKEVLLK